MLLNLILQVSFAILTSITDTSGQQTRWAADNKESCKSTGCNTEKNLVCNLYSICECKIDEITHVPWVYIDKVGKCLPILRETPQIHNPAEERRRQSYAGRPGEPAASWTPECTTLNSHCFYTNVCHQMYGTLSTCTLHNQDPSLNRCQCCHPTHETGFINGQCQLVKNFGESCSVDDECILGFGSQSMERDSVRCRRGVCVAGNDDGSGSDSIYVSIALIFTGFFARVLA